MRLESKPADSWVLATHSEASRIVSNSQQSTDIKHRKALTRQSKLTPLTSQEFLLRKCFILSPEGQDDQSLVKDSRK